MPERFDIVETPLPGCVRVDRRRRGDARGFLSRFYCGGELAEAGFTAPIVQINHTLTQERGTVRGLHFQRAPNAEDKFVSVLRGSVFDVAVDLRENSPTYGRWHGEILSAETMRSLFIPQGFAHGFQTLEPDCELLYLHTASYAPAAEGGVDPLDPELGIEWPLRVAQMSDRDKAHPPLGADPTGVHFS